MGWGVQILGKGRGPVLGEGLIFIEGIRTLLHTLLHHSITLLQLIYNNEADVARIFLFYFNKICKLFFSKHNSYWYIQLCNYREKIVFKPISSQFNIVVGCNLSFTRSLNASYLEMDG